jgi:hypothetical protein
MDWHCGGVMTAAMSFLFSLCSVLSVATRTLSDGQQDTKLFSLRERAEVRFFS